MEYNRLRAHSNEVEGGASTGTRRCEVTSSCTQRAIAVCMFVWFCSSMMLAMAVGARYGWSPALLHVAGVGSAALLVGYMLVYLLGRLCSKAPRAPQAIEVLCDPELAISTAEEILPEPRTGITLLPKDEK